MSVGRWLKSVFFGSSEGSRQQQEKGQSKPLDFSMDEQATSSKNPTLQIENSENQPGNGNTTERKIDELAEKAKDFVSETGKEIQRQGSELWDAVKSKVEDLDDSTKAMRESIKEKASETLEKIDDFVDRTVEKARQLDEEEKAKDKNEDGLADNKPDFGKTLSEQQTGFFDKAEKWLQDQESRSVNEVSGGAGDANSPQKPTLDLPKD
ncbi:MAG: hypothetical protein K1X68_10825 [Saprospiraceae bacterium]|nr:hypothetical protein [Saprospiraceae bacterium]HMW39448.1 YtxH domain-containing protein [Saprospiraceae bacterium]HMX87263.1 YtxH domain-containing protein [Saprospiraceae bacterium]HMZ38658.1 YtxH domain-containing protein [Saprospiraceae bacterium]HNC36662.1 YtxH domain-containing protein [Saprospiraceae bacterium]